MPWEGPHHSLHDTTTDHSKDRLELGTGHLISGFSLISVGGMNWEGRATVLLLEKRSISSLRLSHLKVWGGGGPEMM